MLRTRTPIRLDLGIRCRLHQIVASYGPDGHAGWAAIHSAFAAAV